MQVAIQLQTIQLLLQLLVPIARASTRSWRPALKCVFSAALLIRLCGHPRERSADLVVRQIALSAVGEQRKHSGDSLGRSSLARRNGDEKLHEAVIERGGSLVVRTGRSRARRLDNVHIFTAHALADLHTSLADAELAELDVGGRNAEMVADGLDELWVRRAREEEHIAHHDGGGAGGLSVEGRGSREEEVVVVVEELMSTMEEWR